MKWLAYRNKWGPLHLGMRVDRAVSRVIAHYYASHGKTVKPMDFSPYDKAHSEQAITLEGMFGMIQGAAEANREKHG